MNHNPISSHYKWFPFFTLFSMLVYLYTYGMFPPTANTEINGYTTCMITVIWWYVVWGGCLQGHATQMSNALSLFIHISWNGSAVPILMHGIWCCLHSVFTLTMLILTKGQLHNINKTILLHSTSIWLLLLTDRLVFCRHIWRMYIECCSVQKRSSHKWCPRCRMVGNLSRYYFSVHMWMLFCLPHQMETYCTCCICVDLSTFILSALHLQTPFWCLAGSISRMSSCAYCSGWIISYGPLDIWTTHIVHTSVDHCLNSKNILVCTVETHGLGHYIYILFCVVNKIKQLLSQPDVLGLDIAQPITQVMYRLAARVM